MAQLTLSVTIQKDRVNSSGKVPAQLTLSAANLKNRVNLQKILRYFLGKHGLVNTLGRNPKRPC